MTARKPKSEHKKKGRPENYSKQYNDMAYIACADGGFTDLKLSRLFGISKSTLNTWKRKYPDFLASIQKGKDEFNVATAENSLLKRVKGFTYKEVTMEPDAKTKKLEIARTVSKYIPPDAHSLKFFLKNRAKERWPDKFDVGVGGELDLKYADLTDEQLDARIEALKNKLSS